MIRPLPSTLVLLAGLVAAAASAGTPVKPPPVTTEVPGSTELTAADRDKLAEVQRQFSARRAAANHSSGLRVSPPSAAGKPVEISTRVPARGVRTRIKQGQTATPSTTPSLVAPTAPKHVPASGARP